MLTAVILTYNEEVILSRCLDALAFTEHILVFDSHSTDKTKSIALEHGAEVITRSFDNYASQRNAALNAVPNETTWILMIDADEIMTDELRKEIQELLENDPQYDLYRVRRRDHYRGKWIRYSSGYPTWFPRLFRKGKVRVEREINEEYIANGTLGNLVEHLDHFPFNKGMSWWKKKHRKYAQFEAKVMLQEIQLPIQFRALFSRDPVLRRKFQKRLSYHLPFRPYFIFIAFFIVKRGFLDGKAGYEFSKLRFRYEKMIEEELRLLRSL